MTSPVAVTQQQHNTLLFTVVLQRRNHAYLYNSGLREVPFRSIDLGEGSRVTSLPDLDTNAFALKNTPPASGLASKPI